MEIIYRPLKDLHPNPKNPRKGSEDAIAQLAQSIKANPAFFEARPILLSDRTGRWVIIGGERRSEAAALLGMKEVPTILFTGLTEEQEDEIMVRDNTHSGVWDEQKLKSWTSDQLQNWGGKELSAFGAGQWDDLPPVEGDPETPNLSKPFTIFIRVDKSEKENLETIKRLILKAVEGYNCELK